MPRRISWKIIFYLLFLFLLDWSFVPLFAPGSFRPSFLYLAILYAAFVWQRSYLFPVALAAGLLRDLAGSQPLGVETAVLLSAAMLLDFLIHKIQRDSQLVKMATAFLFSFCSSAASLSLFIILSAPPNMNPYSFFFCLHSALATAIVSPVFFYFTSLWFHDRTPLKQYELFG